MIKEIFKGPRECFPIVHEINNMRKWCYRYDPSDYIKYRNLRKVGANFTHKTFVVISIFANTLEVAISCPLLLFCSGIAETCFVIEKIVGIKLLKNGTGVSYFEGTLSNSGKEILKSFWEIPCYYICRLQDYREELDLERKDLERKDIKELETIPGIQHLNDFRVNFRLDHIQQKKYFFMPFLKHKLISVLNIPLNLIACAISMFLMIIASCLVILKIALYVLTSISIETSTGFVWSVKSQNVACYHFYANIVEVFQDVIYKMGMNGLLKKVSPYFFTKRTI